MSYKIEYVDGPFAGILDTLGLNPPLSGRDRIYINGDPSGFYKYQLADEDGRRMYVWQISDDIDYSKAELVHAPSSAISMRARLSDQSVDKSQQIG